MTRALLEQAMDALKSISHNIYNAESDAGRVVFPAIAAIRAELAKPAQQDRKTVRGRLPNETAINACAIADVLADRAAQQERKPATVYEALIRDGREKRARLEAAEDQQKRKPEQCEWKPEDPDFMPGTYASACGELWSFIDGGPIENRVKFCMGCGKPVILEESL